MKVKCIRPAGELTLETVYEVHKEANGLLVIVLPNGRNSLPWSKIRFVVVQENKATSHKYPGQCPCGITASQCDYHKG